MELREARKARVMMQESLAHHARISLTTVRKLEAGKQLTRPFGPSSPSAASSGGCGRR